MKHVESIAERLAYLGGTPTTKPDPIFVGGGLEEMIKNNVKAEEEAIALYKQTIKFAEAEGDVYPCWSVKPLKQSLRDHSLEEILQDEDFKKIRDQLFNHNCPGCTCAWGARAKLLGSP